MAFFGGGATGAMAVLSAASAGATSAAGAPSDSDAMAGAGFGTLAVFALPAFAGAAS